MKFARLSAVGILSIMILAGCMNQSQETSDMAEADASNTPVTEASWSYEGATGPAAWGEIGTGNSACSTDSTQSPIAIVEADAMSADLPALNLSYGNLTFSVEDTGHGYKAKFEDTSNTLTIGNETYNLIQFHAHTPSEHTLNGESYPMAVHFVHQMEGSGRLAVIGVLINSGAANEAYTGYADLSAAGTGEGSVDVRSMLPENLSYLGYSGSLTTPPCTPGVRWIVLNNPIELSPEQIEVFASAHGMTNRPVQPLYERTVHISE